MPATASKKGGPPKAANRDRRSSSRHSTPVSALTDTTAPPTPPAATPSNADPAGPRMAKESPYLHTPILALLPPDSTTIESLIAGTTAKNHEPPTAKELHGLHERISNTVHKLMSRRGEVCDRAMRQLVQRRKERLQRERERVAEREARELAAQREAVEDGERKKAARKEKALLGKKRNHDEVELDGPEAEEETRGRKSDALPSVGAHGLARQDGVGVHEGKCRRLFPLSAVLWSLEDSALMCASHGLVMFRDSTFMCAFRSGCLESPLVYKGCFDKTSRQIRFLFVLGRRYRECSHG